MSNKKSINIGIKPFWFLFCGICLYYALIVKFLKVKTDYLQNDFMIVMFKKSYPA